MNFIRFAKPLSVIAGIAGVAAAAYLARDIWLHRSHDSLTAEATAASDEANKRSDKIIVSDQAQKNLGLVAKPMKANVYWKTIEIPGIVVDRPGVSDRQVVAPAIGIMSQIHHVPGDIVRPGDVLFTLRLSSDAVHQTQSELFKASQDIKLAETQRQRLAVAGGAIAQTRVIEVESEITRLQAAVKTYRHELLVRGLSNEDLYGVADGRLVSEISIVVPAQKSGPGPLASTAATPSEVPPPVFELQELKVEAGQQVQAGQKLCLLSNHKLLMIEGRAFRDETTLLERSLKEDWPVDVDFQEDPSANWPPIARSYPIQHIANTIDPVTRTFAFFLPLENQSKSVTQDGRTQLLWRFRPGQKVRLSVRVEKLDNVFVLPAEAVVREGLEYFVFTQNVNTFERKSVHVLFQDRDRVVVANDGALPTYVRNNEHWTIAAVVRGAAAQLNRMTKAGAAGVPKGYHIHADGSLHKNEDEGKE